MPRVGAFFFLKFKNNTFHLCYDHLYYNKDPSLNCDKCNTRLTYLVL